MIKVGEDLPSVTISTVLNEETSNTTTTELFQKKKVVLFAVPGAFTPTCSLSHLPGYVTNFTAFKEKGVDLVACLSVNDSFVMTAWAQDQNAESIVMIADGGATLTTALGLELDSGDFGGIRSKRYAMVIEDGKVTQLNVEKPKKFEVSNAEHMLTLL